MAGLSALLGTGVLLAWWTGLDLVLQVLPGLVRMQPATALDFLVMGVIGAAAAMFPGPRARRLGLVGVPLVVTVAGTALVCEIVGRPYPFGLLAFEAQNEGRMSGITASAHLLLAFALAALACGRRQLAHVGGLMGLSLGLLGLSGYAFGVSDLYAVGYFQTLALHTAVGIVLLGLTVLLLAGDVGLVALLQTPDAASALVRNLLPAVVALPLVCGWVAVRLMREGLGVGFVLALYATALSLLNGVLVWYAASRMRAVDARREAEEFARIESDQALADLARTTSALERANTDLRDFTAGAAHDLRGPLSAVLMGVAMLDRPTSESARAEVVARIQGAAERGMTLVDDLLEFGEAGTVELRPVVLDLAELTRAVVHAVQESTGRAVELVETGFEPVLADPHLVWQAVRNLVGNAVKYSPGHGPVPIEVGAQHTEDGMVSLRVADRGLAIPTEERELIFEIFRRGVNGARQAAGTGVGLAVVRRVAERHGGSVRVVDHEGWSKRFELTLPAPPGVTGPHST